MRVVCLPKTVSSIWIAEAPAASNSCTVRQVFAACYLKLPQRSRSRDEITTYTDEELEPMVFMLMGIHDEVAGQPQPHLLSGSTRATPPSTALRVPSRPGTHVGACACLSVCFMPLILSTSTPRQTQHRGIRAYPS